MSNEKKILICIPARYASTRLPAKPLIKIAGKEMIVRVADIAAYLCQHNKNCQYRIATDNQEILDFCRNAGLNAMMTSETCRNGTERCADAVDRLSDKPSLIVNLQGDNPLCPPWIIQNIIDEWTQNPSAGVYTPCVHLNWTEYQSMIEAKHISPFSGTTVLVDSNNHALAFSKSILPAVRKPEQAQLVNPDKSPVRRHVGLYAYTLQTLVSYAGLSPSPYEDSAVEGLEQYRFLHNGIPIKVVEVNYHGRETASGIDSPADIVRAEQIITKYGELI